MTTKLGFDTTWSNRKWPNWATQGQLNQGVVYNKNSHWIREALKKYGIFHILVGWLGLKKSFSIKIKNKKHGLKMPKIA